MEDGILQIRVSHIENINVRRIAIIGIYPVLSGMHVAFIAWALAKSLVILPFRIANEIVLGQISLVKSGFKQWNNETQPD